MAITSMNQLIVGMFNAPAGNLLAGLEFVYGDDFESAAADLASAAAFPYASVNDMVAAMLGDSVDADTLAAADAWADTQTDMAAAALVAVDFLLTTEDEAFANARAQFENKVTVAAHYSTGANMVTFTDVATSQALIASVTSDAASVTAITEAAPAPVEGSTFTLTTGTDNLFGTSGNDTFSADQNTYTAADLIADSSTTDNDTLTITATSDITATPTVIGVENVNFNVNALTAGGNTEFAVDAANIAAGTINIDVTKIGSTVVSTALTNVKSGITVASDLATMSVATAANADVTVNGTNATGTTVTQTGTADTLTVTTTGNFITTGTTAEEAVTITAGGTVSITDNAASAAGNDVDYVINAGGAINIVDTQDTGDITATTSSGNITVGATDLAADGDVSLTTANGDVTVTNADDAVGTITISATGDGDANATGADGDVTVTSAAGATAMSITATGGVNITGADNVETLTITAGQASSLNDLLDVETVTLAGNNASAATVFTVTTAENDFNRVDTINFTGDNDVTLAIDGTDLVAAAASTTHSSAAKVVATDNGSGTSRIEIQEGPGAGLDVSGLAVDELAVTANGANDVYTVASGQEIIVGADLAADLELTASATPGNTATVTFEDDGANNTTANDLAGITTTNIATLNIVTEDDDAIAISAAIDVEAATVVNMTGISDITIAQTDAKTFNAADYTGDITMQAVNGTTVYTSGSGDDSFTSGGASAIKVTAGAGIDTLALAAADYSGQTLTISGFEIITSAGASTTLAGSHLTGQSYALNGGAFIVAAQSGTGETVNLSDIGSSVSLTLNGAAGADTLTGSSTSDTTINAGNGNDTVTAGSGADSIAAGAGNDTVTAGNGADAVYGSTGADTINLSETIAAADHVIYGTILDGSAAGAAAGTFTGYDVITGFSLTNDIVQFDDAGTSTAAQVLDQSAVTTALIDAAFVVKSTAATLAANDLADSEFTDVDAVVDFLNGGGYTTTNTGTAEVELVAVTFSDFTALYVVNNDTTDAAVASEVTLLGTVDAILTASQLDIA